MSWPDRLTERKDRTLTESRPKVLLVSENLGTPSFRRAWHGYSVACLEHLKAAGADVTLVVERAFGFEADAKRGASNEEARLTALYEYLGVGEFAPKLFYRGWLGRLFALYAPTLLRAIATRQQRRAMACESPFLNRERDVSGMPERLGYLQEIDRFLYPRRVYSAANLRAVYDTGPARLDGTGYDLIVIDGLLPFSIEGALPNAIVTIVHDMSAFSAPNTPLKARIVAGQALTQMAKHGGTALFASEFARRRFDELVGPQPGLQSKVLGPLVPRRSEDLLSLPPSTTVSAYVSSVKAASDRAAFLRSVSPEGIIERLSNDFVDKQAIEGAGGRNDLGEALPTVTFVWHDDTRHGVRVLTNLAAKLTSVANLIVIGAPVEQPIQRPSLATDLQAIKATPANLHFARDLSGRDRIDILRHSALVACLDRSGSGPRLLEAASIGRPILCFDTPATREFLGDADATFVPSGAVHLAEIIVKVLGRFETGGRKEMADLLARPRPSNRTITETFGRLLHRS